MAPEGRVLYTVTSLRRDLTVLAPPGAAAWWPRMAEHLPGVAADGITRTAQSPSDAADAVIPEWADAADTRRLVNAYLHGLHLRHRTLCVHAAALYQPYSGAAVLLLGGHGAGKTLVTLALARRGWRPLAGDVALLDCRGATPTLAGGTRAVIVRSGPVRRWFPDLQVTGADLDRLLRVEPEGGRPVRVAVLVDVDGDPRAGGGVVGEVDQHTAATVWLRASGHLLDRVLEEGRTALRSLEDAAAARRRLALVRACADRLGMYAVWGAPGVVADQVEGLVEGSQR